jgi:DNA-directed RNA polymerase specialized sigma24 family protein
MTDAQREVFILSELEQLTASEAAEQLALQEGAVVSRLRRARAVFQEFCDDWQTGATNSDNVHEEAASHV